MSQLPYQAALLSFVLLSSLATVAANAELYEGAFGGHVETIDSGIASTVSVGDDFRFAYMFDSGAIDLLPNDSKLGVYLISSASLRIANARVEWTSTDNSGSISIRDFEPISEQYIVRDTVPQAFAGMARPVVIAYLGRWPTSDWIYDDDSLPLALELADFEWAVLSLEDLMSPGPRISGSIESFSIKVVPEAGSLALLASGLMALYARRRATP